MPLNPDMDHARRLFDLYLEVCRHFDEDRYVSFREQVYKWDVDEHTPRELLRLGLESCDPSAMSLVGLVYELGCGDVRRDQLTAIDWYQKASSTGDAMGMFFLGDCLLRGWGVPWGHHGARAVEWLQKSADLGNPLSMNALGDCHRDGIGVPKDMTKALDWYRNAADRTVSDAHVSIAKSHRYHDPLVGLRYLADVHRTATSSRAKDKYTFAISEINSGGYSVVLRWRELELENEALRTELAYRPGGPGYLDAHADFVSKASTPCSAIDDLPDLDLSPRDRDRTPSHVSTIIDQLN